MLFKPNASLLAHYHVGLTEIYFIIKGAGLIKIENKEIRCEKNDIILIEPKERHSITNDSLEDLVIAIVKYNNDDTFIW